MKDGITSGSMHSTFQHTWSCAQAILFTYPTLYHSLSPLHPCCIPITGYSIHISNPTSLPLHSPPLLQPIYVMKLSASVHLALGFTTFLSAFLVLCLPKQQQRYRSVETRSCCIACPVLNLLNSVLLCPPKCSC